MTSCRRETVEGNSTNGDEAEVSDAAFWCFEGDRHCSVNPYGVVGSSVVSKVSVDGWSLVPVEVRFARIYRESCATEACAVLPERIRWHDLWKYSTENR